jgi:hypothetical protein
LTGNENGIISRDTGKKGNERCGEFFSGWSRWPPRCAWADPAYDVVHASIVSCQANLLAALRGQEKAETAADDNLRTLRLVFGAYESARTNRVVDLPTYET